MSSDPSTLEIVGVSNSAVNKPASRALAVLVMIVVALSTAATSLAVGPSPVGAQRTEGLDEARARMRRINEDLEAAQTELGKLELVTLGAQTRTTEISEESDQLLGQVVDAAILNFTSSGATPSLLATDDVTAALRVGTLTDAAVGADTDALETYRVLFEDLAVAKVELAVAQAAQDAAYNELVTKSKELQAELAKLETLEANRLEAERRKAEAAARAAAAKAAARNGTGGNGTSGVGTASGGGGASAGLLSYCPVGGANSFIDSWGYARSGGRRHKGVDIMANPGVPIVAPVSGSVKHRTNRVGGRSFHLQGDDGNYYYGTHMSAYGASGQVNAGDIIGYVGDDGNARGIPHLHFEIHPGGGSATNPYSATRAACG